MSTPGSVLVTGASGFIGRHVLPRLVDRGYTVHAAARTPPADLSIKVEWHCVDLLVPGVARALVQTIRPTHLMHLAWIATPGAFWTAAENLDWVAASLDLYRGFTAAGGSRVVFAGTCAEYDWSHDWLDEQVTPCVPDTLYGTTKDALHRILRHAAARDGVMLAWGRIFLLYGPYEALPRLVPSVVLPLLRGEPALCDDGLAERDLMHVEDVAEALVMVLDSTYQGPVNVASGLCLPLCNIVTMLADEIGCPDLVRLGARPPQPDKPHRLAAAISILREQIGFTPRYDLANGLAATVKWWRSRSNWC